MMKDLPHIKFKSGENEKYGFDIVPFERIARIEKGSGFDPRLPHQPGFYQVILFTHGKGKHYVDFNWYPVQENTLIYLAKDQVHAFDFTDDLQGYCIVFSEKFLVSCFSNLTEDFVFRLFNTQLFSSFLEIPPNTDFHNYFNLLFEEFKSPRYFNYHSVIKSLFTILITKAEVIRQHSSHSYADNSKLMLFQRFTSLLEKHYSSSRNANYYADKLAITYKHLNSVCKELVNKTSKTVIDDFIILKAKRELINTTVKSTELAFKLGFEDPTNFTKYFKKYTGVTPKSFVQSLSVT